jgi:hypothetical protein
MEIQCQRLAGQAIEPPSEAFALSARLCPWDKLSLAVGNNSHVWNQLEGGAQAALNRIKQSPEGFSTPLTVAQGGKWTLGELVRI